MSNIKYECDIINGKYNGVGIIHYNQYTKYIGMIESNKRNGYGKMYYCNKLIYEGEYSYNNMEYYIKIMFLYIWGFSERLW